MYDVDPNRIAVAGFCYGGGAAIRLAVAAAADADVETPPLKAVAVFYGKPPPAAADAAAADDDGSGVNKSGVNSDDDLAKLAAAGTKVLGKETVQSHARSLELRLTPRWYETWLTRVKVTHWWGEP